MPEFSQEVLEALVFVSPLMDDEDGQRTRFLRQISARTLVVHGANDVAGRDLSILISADMSAMTTLVEIPLAGVVCYQDNAQVFNQYLVAFLQS